MVSRVGGPGGPSRVQPGKTKEVKKTGKPGEFAAHLRRVDASTGEEIAPAGEAAAVAGVGGILAAQAADPASGETPDFKERQRRARRGAEILDRLEDIRRGLLVGSIPKERLAALAKVVREKRDKGTDPIISQLLDEIELRAEVELAKLSRR